jgi:hypothetical protein
LEEADRADFQWKISLEDLSEAAAHSEHGVARHALKKEKIFARRSRYRLLLAWKAGNTNSL